METAPLRTKSRRSGRAAAALLLGLCLVPRASAAADPSNSLLSLADHDLRVASVGYRIAASAGELCREPSPLTGLVLHNLAQYKAELRPQVARAFSLEDGLGISGVVEGSRAAAAALARGDEIRRINGTDVRASAAKASEKASFDELARASGVLADALRKGPAMLEIERDGQLLTVELASVSGCGGEILLDSSRSANAWSDGQYAAVTMGLLGLAGDEHELAFALAHEMSHNILEHANRLDQARVPRGLMQLFGRGARLTRQTEMEADGLAIRLMRRAGYDDSKAANLLRRLAGRNWLGLSAATHPSFKQRLKVTQTAQEALDRETPATGTTQLASAGS